MQIPRLYLYRYPDKGCYPAGSITLKNSAIATWRVPAVEDSRLDCSFEEVMERLSRLPRLFAEPDGSFVWRGSVPTSDSTHCLPSALEASGETLGSIRLCSTQWQLDGMLYDRSGRVIRVEIIGSCPVTEWQQFMDCLQPYGELIAYLVEFQCFVRADELLKLWEP